jgi:hypothetical protein
VCCCLSTAAWRRESAEDRIVSGAPTKSGTARFFAEADICRDG